MNTHTSALVSRRHFLQRSSAAAGAALVAPLSIECSAFAAAANDTLKLALVGCGGRGSAAATVAA